MEKHHSRSSAKRVPPVVDDSFRLPPLVVGSDKAPPTAAIADKKESANKPSREDVSRCINIWASVYLGRNTQTDVGDLRLPSRPWLGRSPNSMKRFE